MVKLPPACTLLLVLSACVARSDVPGLRLDTEPPDAGNSLAPAADDDDGAVEESEQDAGTVVDEVDAGGDSEGPGSDAGLGPSGFDVQLLRSDRFDGYLADSSGRPLYMYVNDVVGLKKANCLTDCAELWPTFDVADPELVLGEGLSAGDFTRFHRDDGLWQLMFKGRPLYYRKDEEGSTAVTADGLGGGRWFVARDYLAFMRSDAQIAPEGNTIFNTPFLTDGLGRTLYIYKTDMAGSDATNPISSCKDLCIEKWPVWPGAVRQEKTALPSNIATEAFSTFVREDGSEQITFRGWPLYYFKEDDLPAEATGHLQTEWRVIDPISFAIATE